MTPRRFLAFLSQTPLGSFNPGSYEPYYALLAAVSGIEETQIRSLNAVDIALPTSILYCCPECLATDAVPYVRASWHRPTSIVCPIHRALISSYCHVCGELRVLVPFKSGRNFTPQMLRHCLHPKCHSRIEESASGHLSKDHPALWLQHELHHPDPSGLAFIRDGRGLQRELLAWLFSVRTKFEPYGRPFPFESNQGLVPHWRGSMSWKTTSALDLAQLLQHPAVEDDLIPTQLIRSISWKISSLLAQVGKRRREEHFQRYRYPLAEPGAVCAFFLAWSEVPVLTTASLATADLARSLQPFLDGDTSNNQKILQVCEHGRRQLLHQLGAGR